MSNIQTEMEQNIPFWFELITKAGKFNRKNRIEVGKRDTRWGHVYGFIQYKATIGEQPIEIDFNISNFMMPEIHDTKLVFRTVLFEVEFNIGHEKINWMPQDYFLNDVLDDPEFNIKYFEFPFVSSRGAHMLVMAEHFDNARWIYAPGVTDGDVEDFLIKMKLTT